MKWIWTNHIKHQMRERVILQESVELALNAPDSIVSGTDNRKVYQKLAGDKLIRVVTEGSRLITVYNTNKIDKYLGGR